MRLDVLLARQHPDYSRSLLQKMIKEGRVKVNGYCLKKSSIDVPEDAVLVLDMTNLDKPKAEIKVDVIYEDKNVVVANKPIGILSHSKGAYYPETSLGDWLKLREHYDFIEDDDRGGIVHRLDRTTSGVIICAKNPDTRAYLQKQFQDRSTKKTYIARVEREPELSAATIDVPIERNPKRPQTFRAGHGGKASQTTYRVLEHVGNDVLLELKPRTGRTHQLRVHMAHLHLPIIGDVIYGGRPSKRVYLHAAALEITLPGDERKLFEAKTPSDFYKDRV